MLQIKVGVYYIRSSGVHDKNYYPLIIITNVIGGATICVK